MNDVLKPVAQWIGENIPLSIGIGVFIFCLLFEISKVKIYPLKWLWKLISWPFKKIDEQRTGSFKNVLVSFKGDMETKLSDMSTSFDNRISEMESAQTENCATLKECFIGLEKRFDKLDEKQQETEERLDMLAAARIKNHVLNFARQCRKGEPHSHEDFSNLFKENKEYQKLVKKYKWENDVYTHDFSYIQRVYDEHNNNGSFLE